MPKVTNEIDIIDWVLKVFREKKLLALFIGAFTCIGIIVALNQEKKYTANVVLAPEITGMGMSQSLGDLASMVGVNLKNSGSSTDAIYPDIYPDVFASNNFIIPLFKIPVTLKDSVHSKTYYEHLIKDNKISFWEYPTIWLAHLLSGSKDEDMKVQNTINPFRLTKKQAAICDRIRRNISCLIDKKTSVITINVTDNDPQVAAILADTIQKRLQQYISMYRTQKARNDLNYAQKIFMESKEQYIKAQRIFAGYSDANTDVILQSFKSKQEELENEMQLKYNMYQNASQQLQSAKSKVQEHMPAFTIIEPATVPLRASSMPRLTIVLIFILLGICLDAFWIIIGRDMTYQYWGKK